MVKENDLKFFTSTHDGFVVHVNMADQLKWPGKHLLCRKVTEGARDKQAWGGLRRVDDPFYICTWPT